MYPSNSFVQLTECDLPRIDESEIEQHLQLRNKIERLKINIKTGINEKNNKS